MKKPLVILTGPTAVGKTKASIGLAKAIGGEIISADSMQVYKQMDIGSAKIKPSEMDGIPHYLIEELEKLAQTKGAEYLHDRLREVDEKSAQDIHANNVKRVIRALEYFHQTGEKISEHNEEQRKKVSPYNFSYFVLNDERAHLYERINLRVDQMINEGLVREVQSLKEKGYTRDMVSMQGLGYKEMLDYLDNKCSLEEAVEIIKRDTRHFAKRQITWFKRESDVTWIDKKEYDYNEERILKAMLQELKERGIINEYNNG